MTTGDEPQLGGQGRDDAANRSNAPMIGGRGAAIIVSARGAYVARNLAALVGLMTDEQRKTHKQAVIQLALNAFETHVRQAVEAGRAHLDGLYADIERCLDDPTQDDLDRLIQRKLALNIEDSVEFGLDYIILGVLELYAERRADYYNAIIWAFYSGPPVEEEDQIQYYHTVWDWQIESAWAILRNQPIPSFADQVAGNHDYGAPPDDLR